MTSLPFTYQKAAKDERPDEEEDPISVDKSATAALVTVGYGSADSKKTLDDDGSTDFFDPAIDFGPANHDLEPASRRKKRWTMLLVGVIFYVAVAAYWNSNKLQGSSVESVNEFTQQDIDLEMLGKSKSKKDAKKEKKDAKKEAKKEKKDEKKVTKEEDKKKTIASIYEPFPGCTEVEIKYIKTPMAFEDHEIFANLTGCHLASVHSMMELSKISFEGLFKMSQGPEIAMSFMSGKPLSKEFWLGGYLMDGDLDDMEWTDGTVYDYGPDFANATEGW